MTSREDAHPRGELFAASRMQTLLSSKDTLSRHGRPWLSLMMLGSDPLGPHLNTITLRGSHPAPLLRERQAHYGI